MKYDQIVLSKLSRNLGVVRDTLEKVIRLAEVLRFINNSEALKNKLALKGGTAINLLYSDLPRLSVDIDLDYTCNDNRSEMLNNREVIKKELKNYFTHEGYTLSSKSRFSHALDSFVISYAPSNGGLDNIKVEINYVMRSHVLPLEHKLLDLGIIENPFLVLTVSKIEIYAGKINALLSRSQVRDLYDTYQMIVHNYFNDNEIQVLKNVVLFYRYIQNDSLYIDFDFFNKYSRKSYVRDLLPVIKKGDSFNLDEAIKIVRSFIEMITEYDVDQLRFIESIPTKVPRVDILFTDISMRSRAINHPLVHWKQMKEIIPHE